jgi:hypothetical protein
MEKMMFGGRPSMSISVVTDDPRWKNRCDEYLDA